jgi:signal transduction histidine kinase
VTIAAPASEVGTNPPLSSVGRGFAHMVQDHLTRPVALHLHEQGGSREERPLAIDAQMSDGAIVRVATTIRPPPNVVDVSLRSFLFYLPFVLLLLAMLTIWATRRVTAPLRAFADAAERLGNEQLATPLAERGPAELQRAARSFNRMQDQIRRFVEERTRMLAAISHDLRTPITRLRLRIETAVENEPEQRKMLQDLDRMDTMIGSALSFLRDAASSEPWETVDLASLLQAICDDFADMGHEVRYSGTVDVSLRCRPSMLSRAIVNLVENAAKFAGGVAVDLQRDDTGNAVILVDDEGPGIPDSAKERAFEAFYRLDPARNPETGGVGLGMAIAKTIVQNHGGHIELRDRQPAGLRVAITLPIMGTESGCAS